MMPPGCGSCPAVDAHHPCWPVQRSSPAPTTPSTPPRDIGWLPRSSSHQPRASLSPADLVPSRNSFPPVLSLAENAPQATRSPVPAARDRSVWVAFLPGPCPLPVHRAGAFPPSGTELLYLCRTSSGDRTSPDNSTAVACSPQSNRAAQIARTAGWWRRRSSRSGTTSRPVPPASRARWCPTAPVLPTGPSAAASYASALPSPCPPAIACLQSSTFVLSLYWP